MSARDVARINAAVEVLNARLDERYGVGGTASIVAEMLEAADRVSSFTLEDTSDDVYRSYRVRDTAGNLVCWHALERR